MNSPENKTTQEQSMTAGVIRARCTCCAEPRPLKADARLNANQLICPTSKQIYLDRGDGWFEAVGEVLSGAPQSIETSEPQALGDRPQRSDAKTRIELETATFA